jgi:hypothetical protein
MLAIRLTLVLIVFLRNPGVMTVRNPSHLLASATFQLHEVFDDIGQLIVLMMPIILCESEIFLSCSWEWGEILTFV